MQTTKLAQLLSKLEKQEITAFEKYLQSPYFNNSPVVLRYWKQLKKYAPSFDNPKPSAKKLYKKLYPEEDFDEKKIRQLRSRFLKLVEDFLAIEQLRNDDFAYKKRIADAYLEKEIKKEFEKRYHSLLEDLEVDDFLTEKELSQKLSLHHQLYFNEYHVKGALPTKDLEACTTLIEQYYARQKLLYAIEWISISKWYKNNIPDTILTYCQALKKSVNKQAFTAQEILEQAVKLLLLEGEQADDVFDKVKKQFEVNYDNINATTKNLILRLLLNFCIRKGDNGISVKQDTFQLYQLGLSDEAIFYKGLMTNVTFINIVGAALQLGKQEWVTRFINKEKYRLYEPQKELYLSIGKATLAFYKKEYPDCLTILSSMNSTSFVTMEIAKRGLKLRTTFECFLLDPSYSNTLFSIIESDMKFINRKTILTEKKRKSYLNLARNVLMFTKWIKNKGSLAKLNHLKSNLIKLEPFPSQSKEWLLNHIEIKMELHKQLQDS